MERKNIKASRRPAPRIGRTLVRFALGVVLGSLLFVHPTQKAEATVGVCITNDGNYDNITFGLGGAYTYTQCSTGFTLSGTGTVSQASGVIQLRDRKSDRSVSAGFIPGQKTGTAAIYFRATPGGSFKTYTINQTNPNRACGCQVAD
jgi:hypothetical protein